MSIIVRLSANNNASLLKEVAKAASEAELNTTYPTRLRQAPLPIEIIVALGSAGAFTALFQIISNILQKNKDRELTIERKGMKLVLKGHSLPEEQELIKQLAPELAE